MNVIDQAHGAKWALYHGDSGEVLRGIPDESIHLSVYSPAFMMLYTYSASERDMGNARNPEEFWEQYDFIIRDLLRITKPGRLTCVHCADVATTKAHHGVIGFQDFPGDVIRHYQDAGWVYHGRVTVDRDPQQVAIRTHAKGLLFVQLKKDASWLRPAGADYICLFRKPGENDTPIHPDIKNDDWIQWARPVWYGIRETFTLNAAEARSEEDERHICPLTLDIIERCIRLWSNPGETVLSPFAGIGSELYQAVKLGRRAVGVELKPSYYQTAINNLRRAEAESEQRTLFDGLDAEEPAAAVA